MTEWQDFIQEASEALNFEEPERFYVLVVEEMSCYGGPEEGGWWYTRHRTLSCKKCTTREEAEALATKLREKAEELWRESKNSRMAALSMLGDDDTVNSNNPEGYIPVGWSEGSKHKIVVSSEPRYFGLLG